MSKNINVNPDHYKVAGRERQGEDVVAVEHKQRFGNVQHDLAARAAQRNRSLEAMREKQAQAARKAAPAATKRKKIAPKKKAARPTEPGASAVAGRRNVSARIASSPLAKRATKTAKKTKRAAASVGSRAGAAAKAVATKAKKAVSPRPKQALPKRPKQAGAARRATPSRKK
ncbi:MAG TPA: hypothetical protein VFV54_06695 [Thermoanaerobaculia bacterium]|nr:hypothetical protein [Thermoanaerobaculia bacterium]